MTAPPERVVTVARLGAHGDGIAEAEDGAPLFVPFTLPGERVSALVEGARGRLLSVLDASPARILPPCPHFGVCGGCDLQHADEALYLAFKRGLVIDALSREGIEADIRPLVPCAPASRRRAVFAASSDEGRTVFGFHEAQSHRIVPIETCKVVVPTIETRLPALRRLAALALDRRRPLRISVTQTASGLDVALLDHARLSEPVRRSIVGLGLAEDFARIAAGDDVLIEARAPIVAFGGTAVRIPPGAFLQAVASAEGAMARLVRDHLAGARQVADLFCGVGTFALRLASNARVHGVEGDAPALAALAASGKAAGLKPMTTERRDLVRRPLAAAELKGFDGLVFDPPRAGALAQAREIAGSSVGRVAAVSCNPATLARDLRVLLDGGYKLLSVTPVDQFLWSRHVEAVALLER